MASLGCFLSMVSIPVSSVIEIARVYKVTYTHPESYSDVHIDGLVQESYDSNALAMEIHLFCINPCLVLSKYFSLSTWILNRVC